MDGDDWADDVPVRPPLPLDDRIWRHPSELGAHGAVPLPLAAPAGRSMWTVALAGGLVGAALATAVMLVLQRDGGRSRGGPTQLASVAISRPVEDTVPTTVAAISPLVTSTTVAVPVSTTTRPARVVSTTTTAPPPPTTVAPPTTVVTPTLVPAGPLMVSVRGSGQAPVGAVVLGPDLVAVPSGLLEGTEVWVSWSDGLEVSGQVLGSDPTLGATFVAVSGTTVPAQTASGSFAVAAGGQVQLQHRDGTSSTAVVTEIGCSGPGPDGGQLWAMLALDTEVAPGTIVYDDAGVVGMVITPDDDGPGSVVAPMELLGALARTRAETGTMQRAWLGMSVGGDGSSAPVITEVQPGSPAEAAGLAVGDTVVAIDGHRIDVPGRFLLAAWASAGAPMTIELERAGAPLNVTVTPQLKNVDLLSASAAPAA